MRNRDRWEEGGLELARDSRVKDAEGELASAGAERGRERET